MLSYARRIGAYEDGKIDICSHGTQVTPPHARHMLVFMRFGIAHGYRVGSMIDLKI